MSDIKQQFHFHGEVYVKKEGWACRPVRFSCQILLRTGDNLHKGPGYYLSTTPDRTERRENFFKVDNVTPTNLATAMVLAYEQWLVDLKNNGWEIVFGVDIP